MCSFYAVGILYDSLLMFFIFQTAILLLRIDDIVSGTKKQMGGGEAPPQAQASEGPEA